MVSNLHQKFVRIRIGALLLTSGLAGAGSAISARLFVAAFVLEFIEVKHYVRLSLQVTLEPVQRNSNHIAMPDSLPSWNFTYLQPKFMDQADVINGEIGSMCSEVNAVYMIFRFQYL
jgi:hypothetical protein